MANDILLETFKFIDGETNLKNREVSRNWNGLIDSNKKHLPMMVLKNVVYFERNGTVRVKAADPKQGKDQLIPFKLFIVRFSNPNLALNELWLEISPNVLNILSYIYILRLKSIYAKTVRLCFLDSVMGPLNFWDDLFGKIIKTSNISVNRLRNFRFIEASDYMGDLFQIKNVNLSIFMDFHDRFLMHDSVIRSNIILDLCCGMTEVAENFSYRSNRDRNDVQINQKRDVLTIYQINTHMTEFAEQLYERFMAASNPNKFFKKVRLLHLLHPTALLYRSFFLVRGTIKAPVKPERKFYEISREDGWKLGMEVVEVEDYFGYNGGSTVSVIFSIYKD